METTTQQKTAYHFKLADLFWLLLIASVLMAVGIIPTEMFFGYGSFLKAYVVLSSIYLIRGVSILRQIPKRQRSFVFCLGLVSLLPFVYFFLNLYNPPFRLPMHKWIGDPVWVFAVPTLSFIAFDISKHQRSLKRFLIHSGVELAIVFPIWTVIWIYLQFVITDWVIM